MTTKINRSPSAEKWRGYVINLLLFVVIVAGIRVWQQRDMVSGVAPALHGITLAGLPYELPTHPTQPVLVHFWGSWCPICRAEQNTIADIAHDHPNVISIAMQSGRQEDVVRYMREQGLSFPVVNDPDGSIAKTWGVNAVPASFIIGTDGKIRFIEVGYTTSVGFKVRLWLAGFQPVF
jgi:thiol-disulfide isomerase/thioredoxin